MRITTGKIESAQKVLVYGPEGIGKSTFAAQFPDPLFIDVEGSTKHLDVKRLDAPESWTMLLEEVRFVILNPTTCSTLVIDTADWAERLCVTHVCAKAGKEGIEDFGYGKGYTNLAEEFGNLLNLLTELIDRGVNVVLTAHAMIRKFEQPDEMGAYDRWELKLGKKTAPLVKEWADMVLFANYKTYAVRDDKTGSVKAQGGKRVLLTSHAPSWDAKNRHGLADELPFEYGAIAPAIPVKTNPETRVTDLAQAPAQPEAAKEKPAAPEPTAAAEPLPMTDLPPHLTKLHQLMAEAEVTEHDVRAAVHRRGHWPYATPIETYDKAYVEGVLIAAWPQVLELINEIKSEDVPF